MVLGLYIHNAKRWSVHTAVLLAVASSRRKGAGQNQATMPLLLNVGHSLLVGRRVKTLFIPFSFFACAAGLYGQIFRVHPRGGGTTVRGFARARSGQHSIFQPT
jgi:hypothetical protein